MKRTCEADGCEQPHVARGFCPKHYQCARRAGELSPLETPRGHYLSGVRPADLIANCALCGEDVPVVVLSKGTLFKCAAKHKQDLATQRARRAHESPEARARRNEYHRQYNRASNYKLARTLGLQRLLDAANGQCEICSVPLTEQTARVDHDHACCDRQVTCGACVRGVLCNRCNTALGLLKDDPRRLAKAIEYLGGQLPLTA